MDFHYTEAEVVQTAKAVLEHIQPTEGAATVVGLTGDLGAGKTTLVQAIARELGVHETVVSPTFVIAKYYETADPAWSQLVHIDAYRIEDVGELVPLGWETLISTPNTLVIVEWPERIVDALPESVQRYSISHTETGRHIKTL